MKTNTNKSTKRNDKTTTKCNGGKEGRKYYKQVDLPNNPQWYAKNEQLLKDVASLPFSSVLGASLGVPVATESIRVPGIMGIEYVHALGGGGTAVDAPTIAARYIYTYVRHANSGSANYEAPDLYMMILAWHSANACLTQAKRAYGVMMHFLPKNKFFAETVVRAMGFDYEDIREHMADFRYAINQAAARLNSIKVPGDMPVGYRWNQLASEYYIDGNSTKSQLYIPLCRQFLKFDGYQSENGTSLISKPWYTATVHSFVDFMDELLDPLVSEEDVGIMSGDIMKAFGNNVTSVATIDEAFVTIPIESEEMLEQIHNAVIAGEYIEPALLVSNAVAAQRDGVIEEYHFIKAGDSGGGTPPFNMRSTSGKLILNTRQDTVDPTRVMTMTRFIPGGIQGNPEENDRPWEVNDNLYAYRVVDCGTELVTQFRVYTKPTYVNEGGIATDEGFTYYNSFIASSDAYSAVGELRIPSFIAFDWAPRIYVVGQDDGGMHRCETLPIGDYDNYTVVDVDVIARMNNIAVLSELASSSHTSI